MALKADPFVQRRLLDLARVDRSAGAAEHRRRTLPELAQITTGTARVAELRQGNVVAQTEVSDLDRAARKLDAEIDQVRARADRDAERLRSGAAARETQTLQSEIASLARRQGVLEDQALELMEQRELADATLATAQSSLAAAADELAAATVRRDDAFADIDDELGRLRAERVSIIDPVPAELLALYERIRATGKVAAAQLHGSRCEACRIDLDRSALNEIHGAGVDAVMRCTECGAILVRS